MALVRDAMSISGNLEPMDILVKQSKSKDLFLSLQYLQQKHIFYEYVLLYELPFPVGVKRLSIVRHRVCEHCRRILKIWNTSGKDI